MPDSCMMLGLFFVPGSDSGQECPVYGRACARFFPQIQETRRFFLLAICGFPESVGMLSGFWLRCWLLYPSSDAGQECPGYGGACARFLPQIQETRRFFLLAICGFPESVGRFSGFWLRAGFFIQAVTRGRNAPVTICGFPESVGMLSGFWLCAGFFIQALTRGRNAPVT
jgi:hypothetical protein